MDITLPQPFRNTAPHREVTKKLDAQRAAAKSELLTWQKQHPDGGTAKEFRQFSIDTIGSMPIDRAQKSELGLIHRIENGRSEAETKIAKWHADTGYKDLWLAIEKDWGKSQSAADAARGAELLETAFKQTESVVNKLKKEIARNRPYVVDKTLHPLPTRFELGENASFPSLHSAMSAAGDTVMEHLDPKHAKKYRTIADDVAFSRVYGGFHFPSDTAAGARAGVLTALHAIAQAK